MDKALTTSLRGPSHREEDYTLTGIYTSHIVRGPAVVGKQTQAGDKECVGRGIHLADMQHPHDFQLQESAFFGLCHHTRSLVIAWM